MMDVEKLVEDGARAILIADGVEYVKRDAEWRADVKHYREMCAKYPDYETGRSMMIDAFRRSRAVIRFTLGTVLATLKRIRRARTTLEGRDG
jgi:hypothetical protein